MANLEFFLGTYTGEAGGGIHHVRLSPESAEISSIGLAVSAKNPSWITRLASAPDIRLGVEELGKSEGPRLLSYRVKAKALELCATADLDGSDPCHIGVHPTLPLAMTAHYSDGSAALWRIDPKSGAIECLQRIQFEGTGPVLARQEQAHAHFAQFLEEGRCIAIADLGGDAVHFFDLVEEDGGFSLRLRQRLGCPAGSGPRHLVEVGNRLYLACELNEQLYTIVMADGQYEIAGHAVPFASGKVVEGAVSAIRSSPDGRFLYVAGRNQNAIAWAQIKSDGSFYFSGQVDCGGMKPRDFNIDPSGQFLIVANQGSDNLALFRLDDETGKPAEIPGGMSVRTPSCICF